MRIVFLVAVIFISLLINGCGKHSSGAGMSVQALPLEPEGIFSATFYPVNQKISKNVNGAATITKYGDDFNVRVKLKNGTTGVHMQGLYDGEECPNEDSDGDGYIDSYEEEKYVRHMMVPFDGDLSGQRAGNDYYPTNNYSYERSTSYSMMISDLKKKNFQLEGKVIVIHGENNSKTYPIACGILSQVTYDPNEPDPDTTPIRVRPRPRPRPRQEIPDVHYPEPEPERPRSRWGRFRDRLERWWGRIGGWRHGGDDDSGKP